MTPLSKSTEELMLKVKYSYKFLQKQVKKWGQNVSRATNFLYFSQSFKKLKVYCPFKTPLNTEFAHFPSAVFAQ